MEFAEFPIASETFIRELHKLPNGYGYIFVFHLSKNNWSYLKEWVKNVPVLGIISIPYSEQPAVKSDLEKLVPMYSPILNDIPDVIRSVCNQHLDKKIILVEIGGYSSTVAKDFSAHGKCYNG